MLVIDASVFNKLFLDEPDRPQAQALFRYAIEHEIVLLSPNLLLYEALAVALHYEIPFSKVTRLLELQRNAGMQLIEPPVHVLEQAHEIARMGTARQGRPSLQDSIYHALALAYRGTFVTADRKHVLKTQALGSVILLQDWEKALAK